MLVLFLTNIVASTVHLLYQRVWVLLSNKIKKFFLSEKKQTPGLNCNRNDENYSTRRTSLSDTTFQTDGF